MSAPNEKLMLTDLHITQVANGWQIQSWNLGARVTDSRDVWIFTDVKSMADWMKENLKDPQP